MRPVVLAFLLLANAVVGMASSDTTKARVLADSIRSVVTKTIVVTGTRNEVRLKDSPVRTEVIGAERIKTTAMVNVGDLLKEQTGLVMSGAVRTGVQMNGLGPDYTMILIDGQPMVGRVGGVLDLSRISVGNISRVEVVKGPMSSMYGSEALAGVINIITKRPDDGLSARLSSQVLTRGPVDNQAELGWANGDLELSGFVNYKNSAAFSIRTDSIDFPYSAFQDGTVHAKARWQMSPHWKSTMSIRSFGSETRGSFVESVLGQVAQNSGSVTQWDVSATAGVEYMKGRARLTTTAYATTFNERYVYDVEQGNRGRLDDANRRNLRLFAQYDLLFEPASRLTLGSEFLYDDIGGTRYSTVDNPQLRRFYRTGVAFAQWEGHPMDDISYVLSGRVDANNVFGEAFSPRLSLLWKPGEHVRMGGSVGTGFKAPDFRQLYLSFSNRIPGTNYDLLGASILGMELEPERSVSFDVSLRYEDGNVDLGRDIVVLYNAEVRLYRNDIRNLIDWYFVRFVENRQLYSYRNITSARTQGLETSLNSQVIMPDIGILSFSAGYQYLDAVDLEVLDAIDAGRAGTLDRLLTRDDYRGLWFRSRHTGTARVQYDTPDRAWSANVRFQFVGRYGDPALDVNGVVMTDPDREVLDDDREYVPGYAVVNVAVSRRIEWADGAKSMTIGAGINNLGDVVNPTQIPGLVGRQFFVQAAYSL